MENISIHIEKLLALHDYVVVPGFGGFVIHNEPARIETDRIIPPTTSVSFNPLMQHPDGLLAIEISKAEKINYRQAVEYIDSEVTKFIQKLSHSKGKINFGLIGQFALSESNLYTFTPSDHPSFLPGNFLLNELNVQPRYYRIERSSKIKTHSIINKPQFYKYAAISLVLIGLFFSSQKVNNTAIKGFANILPAINLSKNTQEKARSTSTAEHQTSSSLSTKEGSIANLPVKNQTHSYHVIVASVTNKVAAENLCYKLQNEKYCSSTVVASGKTYRVSLKSFHNMDDALNYMEKIRKVDHQFKSAWVKGY